MVAFQQSLSRSGQAQLRAVMGERINNMAARVMEWTPLTYHDKEKVSRALVTSCFWFLV